MSVAVKFDLGTSIKSSIRQLFKDYKGPLTQGNYMLMQELNWRSSITSDELDALCKRLDLKVEQIVEKNKEVLSLLYKGITGNFKAAVEELLLTRKSYTVSFKRYYLAEKVREYDVAAASEEEAIRLAKLSEENSRYNTPSDFLYFLPVVEATRLAVHATSNSAVVPGASPDYTQINVKSL